MKKVESIKPTGVLADMIDDFKKDLLLKDLAARLPYSVKCNVNGKVRTLTGIDIYGCRFEESDAFYGWNSEDIKPFLRPMSSMTEEEKKEYELLANHCIVTSIGFVHIESQILTDWLNIHHFDYRGLIDRGLALEATEVMYKMFSKNLENILDEKDIPEDIQKVINDNFWDII